MHTSYHTHYFFFEYLLAFHHSDHIVLLGVFISSFCTKFLHAMLISFSVISNPTWLGKPENHCVVFEQNLSTELNN